MRLPDLVAYQAAVQHPSTAFADPSLRTAAVATGRLGLPRAVTGNFAVTYQLRNGSHLWAVRCFHREAADRASRYAAISQALAGVRDGPLVPIEYLANGVRVGQAWYPITKMPWIEGQPLNVAVESSLGRPAELARIERELLELLADLRRRGIAHGDLQHGNVLVDGAGKLRLVDYDGMFVPALRGRAASESGDPNYQHPGRAAQFDADLDRFAAIVIVVALRALASEPALWRTYNTGDNLLFRRADFADPSRSALFRDLASVDAVRELTERFARVCQEDYARVPALAEFLRARPSLARPRRRSWRRRRSTLQTAVAVCDDGSLVATADVDGTIHLRDGLNGRTQSTHRIPELPGSYRALAFTPSGGLMAALTHATRVTVWDVLQGRPVRELAGSVRALAFSPRAAWLVAATADGSLCCWRVANGRLVFACRVDGRVSAVAVSTDGSRVALSDKRGQVSVWRVRDRAGVGTLDAGKGVSCLAFSSDGARLAVGTSHGQVAVWDLATRQLAYPTSAVGAAVESLALAADGGSFAATTRDGSVCLRLLRGKPPAQAPASEPFPTARLFDWLRRVALL